MKISEMNTTMGIRRKQVEKITPKNVEELKKDFLSLRSQYKNISVVSTGNNWGYGDSAPSVDDSLVIDLSACNEIISFDEYHGLITISPGVTYGQLANYLKKIGSKWITPVHGGGPDCSVVGNALERGYGLTPNADHFGAVQSLKAILNDGELYQGAFANIGQDKLDKLFRHGIGPYTDGLFSQSGVGIVYEMTIKLAYHPPFVEMFYFNLMDGSSLAEAVEAIKLCKRDLGSNIAGINLINEERCLSMVFDYPLEKIKTGEPLSKAELKSAADKFMISPWLVVGMMYGEKELVTSTRKVVLKHFKNIKKRKIFFNTSNKKIYKFIAKILTRFGHVEKAGMIHKLLDTYEILTGTPNNAALKLAYWKNPKRVLLNQSTLDPARDNCGLIWYSPLVEMTGENAVKYVQFIKEGSEKFGINSLITLTTIDDLCFDSTVPILFNRENEAETKRAYEYYQYLLKEGAVRGYFPYRLNIETQKEFNLQCPSLKIESINPNRYK